MFYKTFYNYNLVRGAGFDDDPKILDLGGSGWKVQTLQLNIPIEIIVNSRRRTY